MGFITPEFSRLLSSSFFDLSVLTGHIIGLVVVIWWFSNAPACFSISDTDKGSVLF